MKSLADIRQDYSKASLDKKDVKLNPIDQFNHWFSEAIQSQVTEPNAMTLSTVTEDGRPSGRIVLLKGIENGKFIFFTNFQSQKGRELEKNPSCALTFFWPDLERQVRIEGVAARLNDSAAEQYFQSRPRASQIGAWSSPQSSIIENREILEARVKEMEKKFEGKEVLPKPHQWGGYEVDPFEIEFWQGRRSRLHDRMLYTKADGKWSIHRLAP
jgi:pyridoxamine 5'-phosphate oxidase